MWSPCTKTPNLYNLSPITLYLVFLVTMVTHLELHKLWIPEDIAGHWVTRIGHRSLFDWLTGREFHCIQPRNGKVEMQELYKMRELIGKKELRCNRLQVRWQKRESRGMFFFYYSIFFEIFRPNDFEKIVKFFFFLK